MRLGGQFGGVDLEYDVVTEGLRTQASADGWGMVCSG